MSLTLEQLVDRQMHLFGLITRSVANLYKLGAEKQTKTATEARLRILESNWGKFQENHEELLYFKTDTTAKNQYFAGDLYAECEESYIDAAGTFAAIIDELSVPPPANASANLNASSCGHSRSLPKVSLPKFTGLFSEWIPFRDLFHSMVISNSQLSDVERLHYLRTHVTDEAERSIVNLPVTGENFDIAWRTLKSHYENKRLLAKGHFDSIFSIRPLARESASELKTLLATLKQTLSALKLLGATTDSWDPLVVYFAERLLDPKTHRAWEINQGKSTALDTFSEFEDFLLSRTRVLDAVERRAEVPNSPGSDLKSSKTVKTNAKSHAAIGTPLKCSLCGANHYISSCPTYRDKNAHQRREIIEQKELCFNCLGPHRVSACRTIKRCLTCGQKHHTSIHGTTARQADNAESAERGAVSTNPPSLVHHAAGVDVTANECVKSSAEKNQASDFALLATANVRVVGPRGESVVARALLDQGSELTFITESLAQLLKLERKRAAIPLIGIGAQKSDTTRGRVDCEIRSCVAPAFSCWLTAYILPRLTAQIPSSAVRNAEWPHLRNISLADPSFNVPGRVDLLLGADVYGSLLRDGLRQGTIGTPTAQLTALGWIVSGPVSISRAIPRGLAHSTLSSDRHLSELVEKFWTQEEMPPAATPLSEDEVRCEEHFRNTHSRTSSGRYVVRLPFRRLPTSFGNSRSIAIRALARVQRRCALNDEFAGLYNAFLKEYEGLEHMSRVHSNEREPDLPFYLPHHGVLRDTSVTTKLRVVFNGSQKTDTGCSLNDFLYSGPKLQTDLANVMLLWRRHRFVFSADIEKMFRQILVDSRDWDFQRILWAPEPTAAPIAYRLRTVTYGLACAPYLALRVLKQLATDVGPRYPLARDILQTQIYVDDVLSGADTIPHAQEKIRQLDALLTAGGFQLQKWIANDDALLDPIEPNRRTRTTSLSMDDETVSRALGLHWHVERDRFVFRIGGAHSTQIWTKRTVLSVIARLFDPLGWLSPVIITAKIFFQQLWPEKLGWDDALSKTAMKRWNKFHDELPGIEAISVPRWFGGSLTSDSIELHGFSDASTEALAACVYLKVRDEHGQIHVTLVAAKTRVAPLKPTTVPRLELSAAVLLARLIVRIRDVLELQSAPLFLWSDSTVALTWIAGPPSRWKDFVRNRVALIQELVPSATWTHVAGENNPADVASRGLSPQALQSCSIWWHGPPWLRQPSTKWPASRSLSDPQEDLEERSRAVPVTASSTASDFSLIPDRFSTLRRLLRVTAWVKRAAARFRSRGSPLDAHTPLRPAELSQSLKFWTRHSQRLTFDAEIQCLERHQEVPRTSSLLRLAPFLDADGTLRVGGRLRNSTLETEAKHPAILSPKNHLAALVIKDAHRQTLHGGVQLTLATIRQSFWILGGRASVRAHILRCIPCARQRAQTAQQLMGQLPKTRVSPSRPFLNAGVDYAGPFQLKTWHGRAAKTYKGYLVVFVCFSTSAVHLEVATDYSTAGFLAAYRRFAGRRGVCATITSDCGTNLVGADAELRRLFSAASKDWRELSNTLANDGTLWRFNPPGAPHFGGKWEAAVKSVKFHLRRILGLTLLTYEEFITLLIQVEAILNSRPLCPLSDDPEDLEPLTPGHFLTGGPIVTPPEPSLLDVAQSRLSRWQSIKQMVDRFWQRWGTEYLQRLQGISKWQRRNNAIKKGDIVLVLDERYPPAKWPLGRITDVHPGTDGLVRVVTIKTASTTLQRPIAKICPLPIESRERSDDVIRSNDPTLSH
ncbi:PREDICTED: uncharacterized protein LOC105448195 [Wasmannia auropunctata]|uniref:uncharacterized protein LOC105448195 n=1 Tax=Wasmannia auropunctata TaxID=64793 RepID=UPI0005F02D54|nr:PREDICTED: uncharacterized protein LOC105448195 [Wasmannia auropunctata]